MRWFDYEGREVRWFNEDRGMRWFDEGWCHHVTLQEGFVMLTGYFLINLNGITVPSLVCRVRKYMPGASDCM